MKHLFSTLSALFVLFYAPFVLANPVTEAPKCTEFMESLQFDHDVTPEAGDYEYNNGFKEDWVDKLIASGLNVNCYYKIDMDDYSVLQTPIFEVSIFAQQGK